MLVTTCPVVMCSVAGCKVRHEVTNGTSLRDQLKVARWKVFEAQLERGAKETLAICPHCAKDIFNG